MKLLYVAGAGDLYLAAMDAIYKVNSDVLFFIEGLGQSSPIANNWGDGLCTDKATIAQYGISDPNPFFTALMDRDYLDQVLAAFYIRLCLQPASAYIYMTIQCAYIV